MNIFKRWKERRLRKRQLRELSAFVKGFRTMDQLAEGGLLVWNAKNRQLFIDESLARLMLRNADSWTNFINNLYLWQYSHLCEQAWNDFFLQEELKAVREYKRKHKGRVVGRQEVQRIREARRAEIAQSDMLAPKIEDFEFFIVSHTVNDASVQAVGHYDGETGRIEMALWEEVEPLIKNKA